MTNEIEQLIREKEALERRIALLTSGRILMDDAKLDMIKHNAAQCGKWAVSYKYRYNIEQGCQRIPKASEKWVPLFTCDNREEAVNMLGKAIETLTGLYNKATNKED